MGSLYGASIEVRRRIDGARGRRFVVSIKSVESRAPTTRKSIVARRDVRSALLSPQQALPKLCDASGAKGCVTGERAGIGAFPSRFMWAERLVSMLVGS